MNDYNIPPAYALAGMAGCASPDGEDSPGALYLARVARDVVDLVADEDANQDEIPWIAADDNVPIYTYDVWRTFVDLGAYNEDPTDFGADGSDMEQAAKVCLYIIGERLAAAMLEDMSD